jgi:hypothetical protein
MVRSLSLVISANEFIEIISFIPEIEALSFLEDLIFDISSAVSASAISIVFSRCLLL